MVVVSGLFIEFEGVVFFSIQPTFEVKYKNPNENKYKNLEAIIFI
tara:strand:- start:164 stop:298 length:135 start_codon:yes stop_codon:yes gene_type:complete